MGADNVQGGGDAKLLSADSQPDCRATRWNDWLDGRWGIWRVNLIYHHRRRHRRLSSYSDPHEWLVLRIAYQNKSTVLLRSPLRELLFCCISAAYVYRISSPPFLRLSDVRTSRNLLVLEHEPVQSLHRLRVVQMYFRFQTESIDNRNFNQPPCVDGNLSEKLN